MTAERAKEIFMKGMPVKYDGRTYPYIYAITYRRVDNQLFVSAELINNNSVIVVPMKELEEV